MSFTLYPCASRKYLVHTTCDISSSTLTNSALVELLVFSFCLDESEFAAPRPKVNVVPVWLFISLCTANAASTCHRNTHVSSIPSMSGSPIVARRYFITRVSFFQSSVAGSLTLVHRNATDNCRSGLACFDRNNSLAVM